MKNPYADQPDYKFWRRSVSGRMADQVDPVVSVPFGIARGDRVATAGSCFAQHIARYLQSAGFNYFIPEDQPVLAFSQNENYGTFSARYGNIYTVRQLWQLFQRAYGLFTPVDTAWRRSDGRFVDPFRPRIQDRGYSSQEEVEEDRSVHLAAVRRIFEECDVFIFTLGLTEGWVSKTDGAVYPLAPGAVTTEGEADNYSFHNFTVAEMEADLGRFVAALRRVNPDCRMLLTVSPVALVATYEDTHVLPATIYSKSALRVVAETARRTFPMVGYFPSYEMITGPHTGGRFFEPDFREVRPEGVAYVMSIFAAHYLGQQDSSSAAASTLGSTTPTHVMQDQAEVLKETQRIICDEVSIEP